MHVFLVAALCFAGLSALRLTDSWASVSASSNGGSRPVVRFVASAESRQQVALRLAASVREFRRSADVSVRRPGDAVYRLGFSANAAFLKAVIRHARATDGLSGIASAAEALLQHETRRVVAAWSEADRTAQVAAIVLQLESLTIDAARDSGARTVSEINVFKRAHLADVRYASRRWLVERRVGRQGAVLMSRGVRNERLRRAIEELYRPGAKTGDGGTADALLAEVKAGCRGAACEHFIKAGERRTQLLKILSEEPLSATERGITGELVGALTKALRIAGAR